MEGFLHATPGILVFLVIILSLLFYYIRAAHSGKKLFIRRIAGVDAIDEATGRCAELGRPVSFPTGLTGIGPTLYACLGVLHHTARKAAILKIKYLLPQNDPEVMAIVEETARDAYRLEGKLNQFEPSSVSYLSNEQFAFAAGYIGMIQRERVGAAFLFGNFAAESLILAEAGQQAGAMQVAATISPEQVAFFVCTCDYTLIGEELFAAAAYLTEEPVQLGSLYAQDRCKMLVFVMIIIGVLIATWNSLYPSAALPNLDLIFIFNW